MAGTNQIASDTWVPQTDKFGNQVNPVWAQQGNGTPEQIAAYTTQIRDLANRALSTSGAGADAFNFAGYTLPNNKYVQQALQGWTPPETKVLDPISGRLTSTTRLSYADALAKLGVTPGTTSTYTADKTFAPNDAMAGFTQDQKNNLAGSFSDIGNQKNNASYISSPLVNKTIPVTSDASLGNRQYISDVQKPGYIKGYDTNNGYKQVYVPNGKYVPGISLYPKPTNTITPDKMKNETPINVPGTPTNGASPVGAGEASAMIAGGKTAISDLIQQLTPAQTDAEKKQQALLDQMASLAGQEANKAADQLTAEQSANLPQLRQQFAEINGQIMTKSAEYDALVKAQEGKPITMSSIIGSERAILNAKASDIGMLTARAQALQGQIETAQSTVNRSIDLKYSSIDARLNMYQAQLNALQPTLTKEEKIRAQAQQILLDERKQVLEEQKNTEKQLSSYNIQMMSKYPSAKISITDSYEVANKKIANSAEYKAEQQQDALDTQYKQAQIRNINSEIAKRGSGGGGGGGGGNGTVKVSPLTQSIIDNPSLYDDQTPTNRGEILKELTNAGYDTTNLGTKPLSDTAIAKISDLQTGLNGLQELKTTITGKTDQLGPIKGLAALNPWSSAKKLQANVDLIRQKVGKALEGGVLRKEDEDKYKKILATLTDTPETASYKIDALISSLQNDISIYTSLQQSGGRSINVNAALTKKGTNSVTQPEDLRKKYNY